MRTLLISSLILILGACSNNKTKPDAYGNFETVEVIVSSENNGLIMKTAFDEGAKVIKGNVMAIIDTISLVLQKNQLMAQKESVLAQKAGLICPDGSFRSTDYQYP